MELTAEQTRVLGCLIEKQRTTPESYPLTLNALRLACNQSTGRDPVVDLDEPTVRDAAAALGRRRLVRLASGQGSRATKYRHVANEVLGLDDAGLAVMSVLMLRGPQTPGELRARAGRLHGFAGLGDVHTALGTLIERELVVRLERRPGQKEERYAHRLGGDAEEEADAPGGEAPGSAGWEAAAPSPDGPGTHTKPAGPRDRRALEDRVAELEAEVGELREGLAALRRELGEPDT